MQEMTPFGRKGACLVSTEPAISRTRPTPPTPRSRRLAAAICVLALAACEGAPGGSEPETGGPEADAGPITLRAADVRVLATSDSIARVRDLEVLPDGRVWVLNSVEPFFVGFGPGGGALGAHGRAGGGPAEVGAPSGFVVGGLEGEAWVFDRRRHSLIRVSRPEEGEEGADGAEVPLPRDAIPPGTVLTGMSLLENRVRTASLGDDVILPRREGTGEISATSYWTTIWNADLVALDPGTDSVRTVVSLRRAMGDLTSHFEAVSGGFPPFPLWYRLWAACSGEEVRLYDFVRDEMRRFTADGEELDPVPVPPPFTEVTPRQFARVAFDIAAAERAGAVTPGVGEVSAADSARLLDGMVERIEGTPEQLAGVLPKYVDFRCADDGTMWLRPLDLERGGLEGGPAWLRIAPDGAAREVRFPERFDPYRFTSGRVWGVLRDELDVASVAWVEAPAGG